MLDTAFKVPGSARAAPRNVRISRLAILMLLLTLSMFHASRASADDWSDVDDAHSNMTFDKVRTLLGEKQAGHENDVAWLWRAARLEFDESYQLPDKDPKKNAMLNKGLEYARAALKADDNSAQAHLYYAMIIGQISYYQGNEAKIKVSHEIKTHGMRTIQLDPNCASAHHMMGRWHYELADLSWVERTLAEAIYSKLPDASIPEAIRYFKAAARLEPNNISHKLWLAKSQLQENLKDDAKATLSAAVKLAPKDGAAKRDLDEARKLLSKLE